MAHIGLRLEDELKNAFDVKAEQFGTSSYVLRELVSGFVDGRLTIAPPPPAPLFQVVHPTEEIGI
jgi:hypothetical protein